MIVSIKNLVKRYNGRLVLDHLNLEVEEGEIFGLTGPDGCGKTTALECLLNLEEFEKGSIRLFGNDIKLGDDEQKRKIGIVFQNPAVFQELSVYDNIFYFCCLYVKDRQKAVTLTKGAIERMQLEAYVDMIPKKLSGGLLRRLDVACGIVHKPKLLILDESAAAIDAHSRSVILDAIEWIHKEGTTIIYITHYLEEVEKVCSKIAIMDNGRVIASGSKEELKKMVSIGEKISIRVYHMPEEKLMGIRNMPNVFSVDYEKEILTVKSRKGKDNLLRILDYLRKQEITFGEVSMEMPTLDDVFLELTGKNIKGRAYV